MSREETLRLALQGRGAEIAREVASDFDSGHLSTTWDRIKALGKMLEMIQSIARPA